MSKKIPSYKFGIEWVATNDEPAEMDVEFIKHQISVVLLADLFGVSPLKVARDILKRRANELDQPEPKKYVARW